MEKKLSFEESCDLVRKRTEGMGTLGKSDQRLLYVYYKVATVGQKPNVPRPNPLSPKCPYWDAWDAHGTKLTADLAKDRYVALVQKALQTARVG